MGNWQCLPIANYRKTRVQRAATDGTIGDLITRMNTIAPGKGLKMRTNRHRLLAGMVALAICAVVSAETPTTGNAGLPEANASNTADTPQIYHPIRENQTITPNSVSLTEISVRLFGALLLVVALFLGGAWFFKRTKLFNLVSAKQANLQIVESKSLGSRHSLHVITYGNQRFMISDTPAGTQFLTSLDEPPVGTESDATDKADSSFADKLKTVIEGPKRESASMGSFVRRLKTIFARKTS